MHLQISALTEAGVPLAMIFQDHGVSGVATKRPARDSAVRQCRRGDTLVVWKLDRASRSLLDLLGLLKQLDDQGVKFRSLTEAFDISGPMGKAIVAILGTVAELERNLIQQRTQHGINSAIGRGVVFGKKTIFTAEVQANIAKWVYAGESIKHIAKRLKCHEGSIRRIYKADILDKLRRGKKVKIDTRSKDRKHHKP